MPVNPTTRRLLLAFALVALVGPNGLYLYSVIQDPSLNQSAMAHPVAQAFMIEALMLMTLFLAYVYQRSRSWGQVVFYLVMTFLGSLAFSFPLFLYRQSRPGA